MTKEEKRKHKNGIGLFCFKEKHCENCLCTERRTDNGKKKKRMILRMSVKKHQRTLPF